MLFFYSIVLSLGFIIMSPLFLLRREKYASGFEQRLGKYPSFLHDGRKVVWLHCVSVGETNAARTLVSAFRERLPDHRLVISTTTKTGHELAQKIFEGKADAIVYFPFDFKFSVRRALDHFKPSIVLLMETEIWPRFIHEAKNDGAKVAIVNGRLSERSASRYAMVRPVIKSILSEIDLALMQGENDARRIVQLGMAQDRTSVTGNIKFDVGSELEESAITDAIAERFVLNGDRPLIVAASTHEPEERWLLEAFCSIADGAISPRPRLMIVPRHPERFDKVAAEVVAFRNDPACEWTRYTFARRSASEDVSDETADVILLDSIGELRALYPLAQIVFVGGSLIPHGGQSIIEPAAVGKAIVTGSYTHNFTDAVNVFASNNAIVRLPELAPEKVVDELFTTLCDLLEEPDRRDELGRNATAVMKANRGATERTLNKLAVMIRN